MGDTLNKSNDIALSTALFKMDKFHLVKERLEGSS